ncbi:MAG: hypothetical protein VZS44_04955 [Bacilli bacterium]|nr:hypothetical protein [Bacilli bacterium]
MKNKKIIILIIIAIALLIIGAIFLFNRKNLDNNIPDNYIAIFHGGSGEVTYETYIYRSGNNTKNIGFNYINVVSTTKTYGSDEWEHKVTGRGGAINQEDIFTVAKKNNAYSYVTIPNDDKNYTIEEYQKRFSK